MAIREDVELRNSCDQVTRPGSLLEDEGEEVDIKSTSVKRS